MAITITVDPASQRKVEQAYRRISEHFVTYMYDLLVKTAIYACQSARKMTPISKKKRPIEKVSKSDKKLLGIKYPLLMQQFKKDGTARWVGIWSADSPKRIIEHRGAAKMSWNSAIKKIGRKNTIVDRDNEEYMNITSLATDVSENSRGVKPWVQIINNVKYIAKHVPNIEQDAILLAESRVVGSYMKRAGADAEKIWKE